MNHPYGVNRGWRVAERDMGAGVIVEGLNCDSGEGLC